jgi:hypothetical protein
MSISRYAFTCDVCRTRGAEYGAMPICQQCDRDTCDACAARVIREWDQDCRQTVVCVECKQQEPTDICHACNRPSGYDHRWCA